MRTLTVLHRWFGVAFCVLFAMWFASGAVMHWVPFPELSEGERTAGLSPFTPGTLKLTPGEALAAFNRGGITRLRLTAPAGHPVYVATQSSGILLALDGVTGSAPLIDENFALTSARAHAEARGLTPLAPAFVETAEHDQWTVPNGLDLHRPLHRIALNDGAGTELYVSSLTGEVVRDSTRVERIANFAGSVLHWIYPTALRKHWATWDLTVWWLSLIGLLGALAGSLLGVLRLQNFSSPYRSWMYWHHVFGLGCAIFVLTWIFSGWLSMDHGRIFSDGRADTGEIAKIIGAPLTADELKPYSNFDLSSSPSMRAGGRWNRNLEFEWYRFGDKLRLGGIESGDVKRAAIGLGASCYVAEDNDAYAARSRVAGAPVFRIACGDTWYQIDGADGRIIEKLDASRRAYRWAFRALHTLDFPFLGEQPVLRSALIMLLCALGFAFSLTGVMIAWRRLKISTGGV